MVSYYYAIDLAFILIVGYFLFYNYKHKSYIKTFNYFKLFILISLSAKFASYTGIGLQKFYVTKADTYATLILIGFGINLLIFIYLGKLLLKISNKYINNHKLKTLFAQLFTTIEVITISTFGLYIFMQLYFVKIYIYPSVSKSYSYPHIEKFYQKFLSDSFVNMILHSDTGTNSKEIIFKSFKDSF